MIRWEILDEVDQSNRLIPIDYECGCNLHDDPRCTLTVEEGSASLTHVACGKRLWLIPEDIYFEVPVKVAVETCDNPGGWHGFERCDCGPEVHIELDSTP